MATTREMQINFAAIAGYEDHGDELSLTMSDINDHYIDSYRYEHLAIAAGATDQSIPNFSGDWLFIKCTKPLSFSINSQVVEVESAMILSKTFNTLTVTNSGDVDSILDIISVKELA